MAASDPTRSLSPRRQGGDRHRRLLRARRRRRDGTRPGRADVACAGGPTAGRYGARGRALGRRAIAVATDVTDPNACEHLGATAKEELGRVDILLNNAGLAARCRRSARRRRNSTASSKSTSPAASRWLRAARQMDEGGSIINVSSVIALTTASPSQAAYSASKSGAARADPRPRPAMERPQGDPGQRDLPRLLPHRDDRPVPARIPRGQDGKPGADRPGDAGRVRRDRGLPRRRRRGYITGRRS